MKITGTYTPPKDYLKPHHVDMWYDRSSRSHVVQTKDVHGNQIGDASYIGNGKEAAKKEVEYHKRKHGLKEGYEEDEAHFNKHADSIQKEHNKKSNYHYDKAKEYDSKSNLNGTTTDLHNLIKAKKHREAMSAHTDAANAIVMRHHSGMYKSRLANKLSDSLNEDSIDEISIATMKRYASKDDKHKTDIHARPNKVNEDAAVNNVGGGHVAGLGIGPQGEPPGKLKKPRKKPGISTEMIRRWMMKDVRS